MINQIYPFYRYGEYDYQIKGKPYIPGSSLKGALTSTLGKIDGKFDDIEVEEDNIRIISLYKIQNLKNQEQKNRTKGCVFTKIQREIFMPNLAVEAIESGINIEIDNNYINSYIEANGIFQKRLEILIKYINKVDEDNSKRRENKNNSLGLDIIKNEINKLKSKKIFILGGYKGLINSINDFTISLNYESALYLDNVTNLPYGIFEIIM